MALPARADVLVDTITKGYNQGTWPAGYHAPFMSWDAYYTTIAYGFTLGDQAYSLDSVTINLSAHDSGENIRVGIFASSASAPSSTQIGSYLLNPTFDPWTLGSYTFAASGITLAANTTYWLEITGIGTTSFDVQALNPLSTTVEGITTPVGTRIAGQSAANPGWVSASEPVALVINGTAADAVPEPSSWALFLAGVGMCAVFLKGRAVRA